MVFVSATFKMITVKLRKQQPLAQSFYNLVMEDLPGKFTALMFMLIPSPGRFFGANSLKIMLAILILRYDLKSKTGVRPSNWEFHSRLFPDMSAETLFKIRM
jgi:hypothetical protein